MNGCKLLVLKIRHLLLPTLRNENCIQPTLPELWHIKSTFHLWHFFLQGFDPHYIICTLHPASVFFSIHTNYSCIYQQREIYKLTGSRTDSSSSAAVQNKITQFSPELQEGHHSSYPRGFLEASAKGAQVLPAQPAHSRVQEKREGFPRGKCCSALPSALFFFF